jgi:hypothetical protein
VLFRSVAIEELGAETEEVDMRDAIVLDNDPFVNVFKEPIDRALNAGPAPLVHLQIPPGDLAWPCDRLLHHSASFGDKCGV